MTAVAVSEGGSGARELIRKRESRFQSRSLTISLYLPATFYFRLPAQHDVGITIGSVRNKPSIPPSRRDIRAMAKRSEVLLPRRQVPGTLYGVINCPTRRRQVTNHAWHHPDVGRIHLRMLMRVV